MAGTRNTATGRSLLHDASQRSASKRGLVDHLQAELHRRVDERNAGEGEQRAGVEPAAAGPVRLDGADHGAVGVADGHPLRPPGRARRVEDVGQVVGLPRRLEGRAVPSRGVVPADQPVAAGGRRSIGRGGVDEGDEAGRPPPRGRSPRDRRRPPPRCARMREHVCHLGRGQAGVHGDGHPAGPMGRRVGHEPAQRELGMQMDAHAGPRLEAEAQEVPGHGVGRTVPLRERHRPDVDDLERGPVAELVGHASQVVVHQHRHPPGLRAGSELMAGDDTPSTSPWSWSGCPVPSPNQALGHSSLGA